MTIFERNVFTIVTAGNALVGDVTRTANLTKPVGCVTMSHLIPSKVPLTLTKFKFPIFSISVHSSFSQLNIYDQSGGSVTVGGIFNFLAFRQIKDNGSIQVGFSLYTSPCPAGTVVDISTTLNLLRKLRTSSYDVS